MATSLIRVTLPSPPSTSLPPLRSPHTTQADIRAALHGLQALYCPILHQLEQKPLSPSFLRLQPSTSASTSGTSTPLVDSGYASETDESYFTSASKARSSSPTVEDAFSALRADPFERALAERWLTSLIARASELLYDDEEDCQAAIDQASLILESFVVPDISASREDAGADDGYVRTFTFPVTATSAVEVHLNDGLAGQGASHTDVGLQTWGASVLFSRLVCEDPAAYGVTAGCLPESPRIVELGAGTGLVSLALGRLFPVLGVEGATVVATDFDEAVLGNLRANIAANFGATGSTNELVPEACFLDWADPVLTSPLDKQADVLIATDVVYAPEHAEWLLDCAARLLAPEGVFWLVVTVRKNGKFEGISETVEKAFEVEDRLADDEGRKLRILKSKGLARGQGRGDESGYKLFRIGWAL